MRNARPSGVGVASTPQPKSVATRSATPARTMSIVLAEMLTSTATSAGVSSTSCARSQPVSCRGFALRRHRLPTDEQHLHPVLLALDDGHRPCRRTRTHEAARRPVGRRGRRRRARTPPRDRARQGVSAPNGSSSTGRAGWIPNTSTRGKGCRVVRRPCSRRGRWVVGVGAGVGVACDSAAGGGCRGRSFRPPRPAPASRGARSRSAVPMPHAIQRDPGTAQGDRTAARAAPRGARAAASCSRSPPTWVHRPRRAAEGASGRRSSGLRVATSGLRAAAAAEGWDMRVRFRRLREIGIRVTTGLIARSIPAPSATGTVH